MKKTILKNFKGIKELKIDGDNIDKLKDKIIGIYGPNGSGKSSLKWAFAGYKGKNTLNWEMAKDEQLIDVSIQFHKDNKIAIFDNRIVNFLRTKSINSTNIFGNDIHSLYELLTNRKKIIEKHNAEKIDDSFLKVKIDNLSASLELIDEMKLCIDKIEYKELKRGEKLNKKIRELILEYLQKIYEGWKYFNYSGPNYPNHLNYMKDKYNSNKEMNIDSFTFFVMKIQSQKEITKIEIKNAIDFIKNLKEYFENIDYIVNNFGYFEWSKVSKKMNFIKDHYNTFFESQTLFSDSNEYGQNSEKIFIFLEWEKNNSAKDIWEHIFKNVNKVVKISNEILKIYNINYKLSLYPLTSAKREGNQNFKLEHIKSGKKLSQKEVEEAVSFGELSIISLSLFTSSLLSNGIPENSIIIFDDPISSYDLNKVQVTINIIHKLLSTNQNIKKIIFLSHEKYFLNALGFNFGKITKFIMAPYNEYTELKFFNDIKFDIEFYKQGMKSKNKLTKLISERCIAELIEKIPKNIRNPRDINNQIYNEKPENINLSNPISLISLKTQIKIKHEDFLAWIDKKAQEKGQNIINIYENEDNWKILKASSYIQILNSLNHSEKGQEFSAEVSRVGEKIDLLWIVKKDCKKTIEDTIEIWEKEK